MKRKLSIPWQYILSRVLALFAIVLLLFNLFLSPPRATRSPDYLYVYALDVGQSDATLITTGNQAMLIDCGSAAACEELAYALARYGITKIDILLLTHPHEDHIGNARYLLQNFAVGQVLLPPMESEELAWRILCADLGENAEFLHTGYSFSLGRAAFEVLSVGEMIGKDAENNASAVVRGVFGEMRLLFMGDAGADAEMALLTAYGAAYLDCDYLKIGHHGSAGATTMDFLLATSPTAVSISCGKANSFGFPTERVLADLNALGVHVARTDRDGTVVFGTDGRELRRISNEERGLGQ